MPDHKTTENERRPMGNWYDRRGPKAPIAWYGGKYYIAKWIIDHIPEHRVYVEPFGGMANVLLKKHPSEVEVFNDLDDRVVNLFRVIRDPDRLQELKRRSELTPYSRSEFVSLCEEPEPEDEVDRAWWFFVRCRQARGGIGMSAITKTAWATSKRTRRGMPETISKYLAAIDGLDDVAQRFRHVVLEAMPAIELIKKYDGPDVLFYCDPPYPAETRHGRRAQKYAFEMTDLEHRILLETLKACSGKVLLSSYDTPLYSSYLKNWNRSCRDTRVQLSNSGGDRQEILWQNW